VVGFIGDVGEVVGAVDGETEEERGAVNEVEDVEFDVDALELALDPPL